MKNLAIIIILLCSSQHLLAQINIYNLKHLGRGEGISGSLVFNVVQDEKGYIWISSSGGLQRFDGKNFITYRHEDANNSSLSYDQLAQLTIDQENRFWAKAPGSFINIFDPVTARVTRLGTPDDLGKDESGALVSFCKDTRGDMWICGHRELYHYSYERGKPVQVKHFPDSAAAYDPQAQMITDNQTGNLWMIISSGIMEYDRNANAFLWAGNNPRHDPVFGIATEAMHLFIDRNHNLWLLTYHGLYRYNLDSHLIREFHLKLGAPAGTAQHQADLVTAIVEDSRGSIWTGSSNGAIYKYLPEYDSFTVSISQVNEKVTPTNVYILSLFNDREGNIWIGSTDGIYIFNQEKQKIFTIQSGFSKHFPSLPSRVQAFFETSDSLIFVSGRGGAGVAVLDQKMNLVRQLFNRDATRNSKMTGKLVWSFCEDKFARLWMAADKLLAIYDLKKRQVSYMEVPEMDFPIYGFITDSSGILWIAGASTIIRLDPVTRKYIAFSHLSDDPNSPAFEIFSILIDHKNRFWVGTSNAGLLRFDPQKGKITESFRLPGLPGQPLISNNNIIGCLKALDDTTLLAGTGYGLHFFNIAQKKFTPYPCNEGTLSNVVHGLEMDSAKNIYLSTFNGLYKTNPATHYYVHYDYEDGIKDNVLYTAVYKLRDGRMLTGAMNSFIYFDPAALTQTFTPPDVSFTAFKIFDQEFQPEKLVDSSRTIQLPYDKNFITVQYSSMYFSAPTEIRYFYKLDGIDKDWVNAGSSREASYTNLEDGRYSFEVRCINAEGVYSRHVSTLNIYIHPPWWKRWWAYLFYVIVVAGTGNLFYQSRIRKINEKQKEQLETMVATQENERKRIAFDLHDDIGTRLSALRLFISSMQNNINRRNYPQASHISTNAVDLIEETIKQIREMLLNLSPSILDEFGYTTAVETLVNKINLARSIQFNLVIFGLDRRLPKHYELALYRITQELINNVIKHSEAKNVSMQIGFRDQLIILMIEDDGKGFDMSLSQAGYGLKNLQARTKLLGGSIHIDSTLSKGTSVLIEIPFQFERHELV
jgi:signal transduction histidine kinase/ligand-binding sensor domain-containing protein